MTCEEVYLTDIEVVFSLGTANLLSLCVCECVCVCVCMCVCVCVCVHVCVCMCCVQFRLFSKIELCMQLESEYIDIHV